jgi:diguanylate cyclase (GGDEF)-like protein
MSDGVAVPNHDLLVVDDSAVYRKLLEQLLEGHPYTLLFAKNGEEALKIYHEKLPSIVISDWVLPDFSGLELCQKIREHGSLRYTYIVLMTSSGGKVRLVEGLEAGADDYVMKPFDSAEMLARIGVGRRVVDLHREIEQKSLKLEEAARTDVLTGLPNRRAIEEWGNKQLKGAKRHAFQLWAVLCDLDTFKEINDTFGHEAGDTVLRTFADILKNQTRQSDMCARLGGDEFLLVISHVDRESLELAVNRMREQFAALSFPFAARNVSASASFGIAGGGCGDTKDFAALVRKADEMLYEAKRTGRNSVRVAKGC